MESHEKVMLCAQVAIEKKAENTRILNLTSLSAFTDYFIICTGRSNPQIQAIADSIEAVLAAQGNSLLSLEGYSEGLWILMDYGELVVHIFSDTLRDYYDLEGLWKNATSVKIPSHFYHPSSNLLN